MEGCFFYDRDFNEGYYDFHFMRQDEKLQWAHKELRKGPIRCWGDDSPKIYNT